MNLFRRRSAAELFVTRKPRHYAALYAPIALFVSSLTHAQTPPDAGSLLQQIEKGQQPALPPKSEPLFAPPEMQPPGDSTVTVTVGSFHFAGNTLLSDKQLAQVVARFVGRPLTFPDLQNAAIAVATAYRRAGWVIRAYLPQQDITSGSVTIQVVEARFGAAHIEGHTSRISNERLQSMVDASQAPGKPVNADALDRAILLANDVPGLSATARLSQGQNQGETDLFLAVKNTPFVSGVVTADNAGARSTGAGRVLADVDLNSPLGFGDRVDAILLGSQGSNYERLDYTVPAGSDGWRVGVNASHLNYRVVPAEFSALDAHGTSTTAGLEASYPLLRSRLRNLYLSLNLEDNHFNNASAGNTTTRYQVLDGSVGLYGNLFDSLGGGGANSASVTLAQGNTDLADSPNEGADALTTHTAGGFQKLRFSLSRQQVVTERLSLFAQLSAQVSSKNLDSSEKFYLGGAEGVRAYPESEGGGAEGVLANLEARVRLPANLAATGFFDWGTVHVNKDNDIAGAAVPNTDTLKGAGVSLAWTASFGLSLKATFARRIGSNPDATSTGTDQDGSHIENRLWVQASMPL